MLREIAGRYYLEGDYNCAEALLRAANDAYALGLSEDALRLMGGYGGGFGCGETCGALCAALAALSAALVEGRAHATPGFREACTEYVADFHEAFGSLMCREIKPHCAREGRRCVIAVERAADLLEAFFARFTPPCAKQT